MSDEQVASDPLSSAEAAAETLLSTIPDLAYVLDQQGQLRWWNDKLAHVTGYDEASLHGIPFEELLAPEDREAALEAFAAAKTGADDKELMELDLLTEGGELIPYEFSGGRVTLSGEFIGVAGIGRDISSRTARREELKRRRGQTETLYYIGEAAGEVIDALVEAGTREALEQRLCERIAASERYRGVWVGRVNDGRPVPAVGEADPDIDDFLELVESLEESEWPNHPVDRAIDDGEVVVVHDVQNADLPERVRKVADEIGVASALVAPLIHRGNVDGVLVVYSSAPTAFSERERIAFSRLGRYVGFAIYATRTEQLLLGDSETELVFDVSGSDRPLIELGRREDCRCQFEWATPGPDGRMRHYASVEGTAVENVREVLEGADDIDELRIISQSVDGSECLLELVAPDSLVKQLVDVGGTVSETYIDGDDARMVVTVSRTEDVSAVSKQILDHYPDADLVAKHSTTASQRVMDPIDRLTDRQLEALSTAYRAGYFEWPRNQDAEAVAADMDVSSATFHYHLRGALQNLVAATLDGPRELE